FYEVGRIGVQHLIERGRRRIAAVFNDLEFSYAVQRHQAYRETLAAAGLDPDERLVWVMDRRTGMRWTDPFTNELADRAVEELVVQQHADAIVAVNDSYA